MSTEKTEGQLLAEKLFYKKRSAYAAFSAEDKAKAYAYAEKYKQFLDRGKTEREAVKEAVCMAEEAGFKPYTIGMALKPGDKMYYNNRGKSIFLFTVGNEPIENGIRITAAHIDSPRLDLKQNPLFEENGFGYFKTHYYGGIRKYQWVTIPLALHGTVTKKNGENIDILIGEDDNDPVFCITDLLPHLAVDQAQKPLQSAFNAENFHLLIGNTPYDDEKAEDKVKLTVMSLLNEKYGIVEEDFLSAELCAVPAGRARDVGLDRALIGGYGHDDRVCAYPAMTALLDSGASKHTAMCILADKEEVGSNGNTGMISSLLPELMDEIAVALGGNPHLVRANSKCLSADVSAGFDPLYPDVIDRRNGAEVSSGVVMSKYTGARGKSGTNDASAEFIGFIRGIFEEANIVWQTCELGRVDLGGGGTVAMFIANSNIDVVDLGVPVLSMHAPFEVISKMDLYSAYQAFSAFYR